jgi:SagB-type dehydrogenase family enzyme
MDEGIGARFVRETRHNHGHLVRGRMDWSNQPEWFTTYAGAPRVALPPPEHGGPGIFDVLRKRRSRRRYSDTPLTLAQLAQLLWAGSGITGVHAEVALRAAPSAGALYPIETYVVVHRVEGLAPGLYHYAVREHALEQLRLGDLRDEVARAALDQPIAATAAAVFVWTAVFERCRWKYGQRAYRYIWLDAAHIAENVALAAVGLGLGSCQIAAIYDDEADGLLGVDGEEESCLYMTSVGHLA